MRKEKKTMKVESIHAARDEALFESLEDNQLALSLLLAVKDSRNIQLRSREEVAIEEEDFWTQAEEANAIDPVG